MCSVIGRRRSFFLIQRVVLCRCLWCPRPPRLVEGVAAVGMLGLSRGHARPSLILGESLSCRAPGKGPVHSLTSRPPLSWPQKDNAFRSHAAATVAATFLPGSPCVSVAGEAMLSWEGLGQRNTSFKYSSLAKITAYVPFIRDLRCEQYHGHTFATPNTHMQKGRQEAGN